MGPCLPGDALQYFFLILVQTYSKSCVSSSTHLHLVNFNLCNAQLLENEETKQN